MNGRLFRSREDRMIAGVAGGLAAWLRIDPSIVRILWVILIPFTGGLILLLYLVMAIIVPAPPFPEDRWRAWEAQSGGAEPGGPGQEEQPWSGPWGETPSTAAFAGGPMPESVEPAGSAGTSGVDDVTRVYDTAVPPPGSPIDAATPAPVAPPSGLDLGLGPDGGLGPARGSGPTGPVWPTSPPGARPAWAPPAEEHRDRGVPLVFGLILVLIGLFFLARSYLPDIDWDASLPILLVGIGIALLIGSVRRSSPRT